MTSSRKLLLAILLAGALAPAPAQAAVTVRIDGTDSGDNPHDTLTVTGDDAQDIIDIREGFEGDVGPNGAPDTCGGNDQLCFLTVEANKAITAQGPASVTAAIAGSGARTSTPARRAAPTPIVRPSICSAAATTAHGSSRTLSPTAARP